MTAQPQIWHHGLVARWWAEFNTDGPEIDYFGSFIRDAGGCALDAACGTGRLLIPFLRDGLDVDGCDISADMLAHCRETAGRLGLKPNLYQQALHELDLPRSYSTVVVCGAFGLGGSRTQDQQSLVRIRRHLRSGGRLVFDNSLPYADPEDWRLWTVGGRAQLPHEWPTDGRRRRAADGDEIELRTRVAKFDPLSQVVTWQVRASLLRGGHAVTQEEHTMESVLYFRNELVDMLRLAGYEEILVLDGYSDRPASADSSILTFVASG